MRILLATLVLIGAVVGGAAYYAKHTASAPATEFRVATIQRGDVAPTISATGTLEAEDLINVGAQVAGLITGFGKDIDGKPVDYNSFVEKDMELAYIDQSPYKAAVEQAEAMLDKAKADLLQYEAKAIQAQQDAKRAESLHASKAISDSDYDTLVANKGVAAANVAVATAAIKANQAALNVAQTNLNYTVIKSPVRGTIIDRRVNIGQTVVASLNAPSLFLIAKDLQRMQVWALRERGQHRTDLYEHARPVHRRRSSERHVPWQGDSDPHERSDDFQRGQLLRHHRGRQSRRKTVSVHDGQRFVRGTETDGRAGGS